jgi:hypothetical protein
MEQRAVIRFLALKGLCASAIAAELKSVYDPEALALSTVEKWRKRFGEGKTSRYDDPGCGRLQTITNDLAEAISSMLKEGPYFSCRILCRLFRIAKGTCLRILHGKLGMKKFHLCCVPWVLNAMDPNQKAERVTLSHGILSVLQSIRSTGFQSIITGDESCFFLYFLYYPRDSIWASSRSEVPVRVNQKNNTEKCLISFLWSVNGIQSLVDALKGSTYDSALFCDTVVPNLFDGITIHSRRKPIRG